MRIVEATAETRKEAIEKALGKLGADRDEVEVEIIDEGSKGFLGIGQRNVQVRVKAEHLSDDGSSELDDDNIGNRVNAPEPRQNKPARRGNNTRRVSRRGGGQNRDSGNQPRQGGGDVDGNKAPEPRQQGGRSNRKRGGESRQGQQKQRSDRPGNDGNRKPRRQKSDSRRERGPRRDRSDRQRSRSDRPRPERPKRRERTTPIDREVAEKMAKEAAALLSEIIEKMGMDATVEGSLNKEDNIVLDVNSEDTAILIGRKGRNREALQFVINRVFLRGDDVDTVDRIVVDIEGYLERRRETLEGMALTLARKAKESGRSIRIKPLDPQERRIVHLALEDDSDVRTYSLGSSTHRRVVIVPNGGDERSYDEADEEVDIDDAVEATEREDSTVANDTDDSNDIGEPTVADDDTEEDFGESIVGDDDDDDESVIADDASGDSDESR